jgi:hypothetical protein
LEQMGFRANEHDKCVFNCSRDGKQITVCAYVDDLLITSALSSNIDWVYNELVKVFKKDEILQKYLVYDIHYNQQEELKLNLMMAKT